MTRNNAADKPASPKRRVILVIMGCSLALMLLISFVYRTMNPNMVMQRQADHEHGAAEQQAQAGEEMPTADGKGMPPAMNQALQKEIGKLMKKMQENPKDVATLLELANHFMSMQAWDKAQIFLGNAVVEEPANLEALYRLGICEFQLGKPKEAADYFEQLIALEPHHAHTLYNLGVLKKHYLNKPEEAKKHFEAVSQLEGVDPEMKKAAEQELKNEHTQSENAPKAEEQGAEN